MGRSWGSQELGILRDASSVEEAHERLAAAGFERSEGAVRQARSKYFGAGQGLRGGAALVMRPDWPLSKRRALAALAEKATSGMSLSEYDRELERIREGVGL